MIYLHLNDFFSAVQTEQTVTYSKLLLKVWAEILTYKGNILLDRLPLLTINYLWTEQDVHVKTFTLFTASPFNVKKVMNSHKKNGGAV